MRISRERKKAVERKGRNVFAKAFFWLPRQSAQFRLEVIIDSKRANLSKATDDSNDFREIFLFFFGFCVEQLLFRENVLCKLFLLLSDIWFSCSPICFRFTVDNSLCPRWHSVSQSPLCSFSAFRSQMKRFLVNLLNVQMILWSNARPFKSSESLSATYYYWFPVCVHLKSAISVRSEKSHKLTKCIEIDIRTRFGIHFWPSHPTPPQSHLVRRHNVDSTQDRKKTLMKILNQKPNGGSSGEVVRREVKRGLNV